MRNIETIKFTNEMKPAQIGEVLQEAFDASANAGIGFENAAAYNEELRHTFERTVTGIENLAGRNRGALRILEIGSFTGVVSVALKIMGYDVTASDMPFILDDPGLKHLFDSHGIATLPANLRDYPFPALNNSFDLIVFNEVIEHLNFNPIPLLREFYRILKAEGRVYCATPNLVSAKNRWIMLRGNGYVNPVEHLQWNLNPHSSMSVGLHWREWTKSELIELYDVCGFDLERHAFGLVTPNRSGLIRKTAVSLMYRMMPSLLPNQVAIFRRKST